jgi:acetylornithine/N-succinyldiaminopimelate aminotransferase
MKGSFHGRTTGAMSMTGQYKIREGFGDLLPGFDYIEENNITHT